MLASPRMWGRYAAPLLVAFLISATAHGQGTSARVRLVYRPVPGCPDEQGFRDVVAAQMKSVDPFTADGARQMTVTLTRRAREYQGTIALLDAAGKPAYPAYL